MEYPRLWPWLLVGTGCKFVSGDFSGILHSINRVILKYLEHLITGKRAITANSRGLRDGNHRGIYVLLWGCGFPVCKV